MQFTATQIPQVVGDDCLRATSQGQFDQMIVSLIRQIGTPTVIPVTQRPRRASAYESIALARRRKFGPSSKADSIHGRLFDEAELLALTLAPGEPGAEESDLADVAGAAPEGDSAMAEESGSVASKATETEDPRVCKSTDWKCVQ